MADNTFGRYLKRVRVARHLKQKDVGAAIGKSTAYICDLEKGRRGVVGSINPLILIQLADYLNVPVSEILYRAGVIDKELEARYGQYYKILRSKIRAQRVGKCLESCKNDVERLIIVTNGTGGEVGELLNVLQSRILELDSALTF